MKKTVILSLLFAGFVLTSCKKDRTCECTDTIVSSTSTEPGYTFTPTASTTSSIKYTKVKKNNVLVTTCVPTEETRTYVSYSYNQVTGDPEQYLVTQVSKSDCSIK